MTTAADEYLSAEQLSDLYGIPGSTWRYWASIGTGPPSLKIGRRRKWRRSDVEKWIAAGGESLPGDTEQTTAALAVLAAVERRIDGDGGDAITAELRGTGREVSLRLMEAVELIAHMVRLSDRPDEMLSALRQLAAN